jgi:hypothetical protein
MRAWYNGLGALASIVIAAWSLWVAIKPTYALPSLTHVDLGKLIIGFWVIVPPVFFWIDWVAFLPENDRDRDVAKHTHDLARNIWLALVGILAVLFSVKFPT